MLKNIILAQLLLLGGICLAQSSTFSYEIQFELLPLEENMGDSLYKGKCIIDVSNSKEVLEANIKIGTNEGLDNLESLLIPCTDSPGILIQGNHIEI